jgi:hypothetical protein
MQIRGRRDAGAALWQALTGRAWSRESKKSVQQKTREMVDRWGSPKNVAQRLGTTARTIQRRLAGKQGVGKQNKEAVDRAHRAARITPGRAANLKGAATSPGRDASGAPIPGTAGSGLSMYGVFKVSEDIRERWINPGPYIPQGDLDRVVDAMIANGPEGAVAELNAALGSYVAGMQAVEIWEINF